MTRFFPRFSIAVALLAACLPAAFAAPGDLDPNFGDGGILKLELADFSNADALVQLPSGRILSAGGIGETGAGGIRDFLLMHLTPEGLLDDAFDGDGFLADSVLDTGSEEITRFLVQTDGKIVASGFNSTGMSTEEIVVRYNADGTRDTGFGDGGVIRPAPGTAIALDLDGSLLVGGPGSSADKFTVTRYTNAGVLDTGFASGGTLTGAIGPASQSDLRTLAVDAENRIVVGTKSDDVDALARFLSDGSPDTDFGTGGFIFNFCNDDDSPTDMAFQSDGKIVLVAKTIVGGNDRLCLLRFTADGQVDNDFDGDGKVVTDIPGVTKETPTAIDIMKDDRIAVGGEVDAAASDSAFFAARYNADGTPDDTFSGDGFAVFNLTPGDVDFGADVAVLNDGRIAVSGASARSGTAFFDASFVVVEGDVTDLTLTMLPSRTDATVGDGASITFTITVSNKGPLAAHGVRVLDSVPSVLSVSSASSTHGTCSGGPEVSCDLGVLAPDEDATVIVTAAPALAGTGTNEASVSGQIGDSAPDDNAVSTTITVNAAAGGSGGGSDGGGCALIPK
jgi:uncharacterized delta-60 repeat protein/uncharacterized repeat protein (TIGR01451 family)